MSVIAALISTRDGVVASDGRQFSSVPCINGVLTQPQDIASDDFDKTFILGDGKIVGAFCGLLYFSGNTVAEHIVEITRSYFSGETLFTKIIDHIVEQLTNRLNGISEDEVIPNCRNVDLLLVGGAQLSRMDMIIAGIRFQSSTDGVSATKEIISADKRNRYYVYGDDLACVSAAKIFEGNHLSSKDASFLIKLTSDAIYAGIASCGPQKHGINPACGGKIFTKRTWY